MCANCKSTYKEFMGLYEQATRLKIPTEDPPGKEAREDYENAVRNCKDKKQEVVVVRDYWNKE